MLHKYLNIYGLKKRKGLFSPERATIMPILHLKAMNGKTNQQSSQYFKQNGR